MKLERYEALHKDDKRHKKGKGHKRRKKHPTEGKHPTEVGDDYLYLLGIGGRPGSLATPTGAGVALGRLDCGLVCTSILVPMYNIY